LEKLHRSVNIKESSENPKWLNEIRVKMEEIEEEF
jgi:hypothetical protein